MSNIIIGKIVILFLLIVAIFLLIGINEDNGKVYNCDIARWHPDIPKEVREECRKLHIDEMKRHQELDSSKIIRT